MDWMDLLAVQGTLKSLLQQHSSKASTESLHWPSKWAEITLWFTIVGPKIFTNLSVKCTFKVFRKCFFKVSDSLQPQGLQHTRFLCPWNSPVKNIGVGCHFLLQGIFLTQGSNPGLLHCRRILYHLSHQGGPIAQKKKPLSLLCFFFKLQGY